MHNGEVAAVDDPHAQRARLLHQHAKPRVQFRRTAGQIQRGDAARAQDLDNQRHRGLVHHLGSIRPGVDVAVQAGLIAPVTQVHLQGRDCSAPQGGKIADLQ